MIWTLFAVAAVFRVTPYVQHPATNAMSLLWLTDKEVTADVEWWIDGTEKINEALEAIEADGTLAKIFEKYDLVVD